MSQKVLVQLIDDLDGSVATETVEFALDGIAYEIDASTANAGFLRNALADYVAHARVVGKTTVAPTRRGRPKAVDGDKAPRLSKEQLTAIREWARKNGYDVSDRGRIRASTLEAFEAAHAGTPHASTEHDRELVGATA